MNTPTSPELLAPAGSPDAAWAALSYGADAVFTGLQRFSARAEAVNLTEQELDELIGFAHANDRKIYITLNTLTQQHELGDALELLALIHNLNADGVIVQDMGVARMARRFFPSMELHASTQLAVHNTAGAQLLADIGFSRVVLARELSLPEIGSITRDCGIETEVFVHGALCYSYSGLCLFSSHLTGRSGNRGRCAYSCRQTFDTEAGKGLPFSMKDFAVGEYFDELLATGVASLKIEGRMKSPAYVGAVTDFYRKRMDDGLNETEQHDLLSDIQTIFGRPATDLYLKNAETNPIDPTTNGHRGAQIGTIQSVRTEHDAHWISLNTNRALQKYDGLKIEMPGAKEPFGFSATDIRFSNDRKKYLKFEVPANSDIEVRLPDGHPYLEPGLTVYCSISQKVRQRYGFEAPRPGTYRQRKPFDAVVELTATSLKLIASSNGIEAQLDLEEALSEARQPEKTEASIRKSFGKTGETEWILQSLEVKDNGLFAPASILNEARRTLLEKLSAEFSDLKQQEQFQCLEDLVQLPAESKIEERWSIKLRDLSLLDALTDEELEQIDEIVLEGEAPPEPRTTVRIAVPVIQRTSRLTDHASRIEVANVGALYNHRQSNNLTADWPLYTLNTEAAEQWKELGIEQHVLSPEDTGDNLIALLNILGDRAIVPIYQHTPLMMSATPPDTSNHLSDRRKKPMQVETNGDQYVLIYEDPFCLTDHLPALRSAGARRFRIDLSYGVSDAEQAAEIIRTVRAGLPIPGSYDGNFDRAL